MKSDKKRQKVTAPAKSLRNEKILIAAAAGKTQSEIASELNLERRTIGKVLNSAEAKEIAEREKKVVRLEMYRRKELAYAALDRALKSNDERIALEAGKIVLKSIGEASEKLELEHSQKPKPVIIHKAGSVVLGMGDGNDDKNEGEL